MAAHAAGGDHEAHHPLVTVQDVQPGRLPGDGEAGLQMPRGGLRPEEPRLLVADGGKRQVEIAPARACRPKHRPGEQRQAGFGVAASPAVDGAVRLARVERLAVEIVGGNGVRVRRQDHRLRAAEVQPGVQVRAPIRHIHHLRSDSGRGQRVPHPLADQRFTGDAFHRPDRRADARNRNQILQQLQDVLHHCVSCRPAASLTLDTPALFSRCSIPATRPSAGSSISL